MRLELAGSQLQRWGDHACGNGVLFTRQGTQGGQMSRQGPRTSDKRSQSHKYQVPQMRRFLPEEDREPSHTPFPCLHPHRGGL